MFKYNKKVFTMTDYNIGTHIKKEKTYLLSLKNFYENDNISFSTPCQIFTGSTKSWRRAKPNEKDIKSTYDYVTKNKINFFIHSIYLINFGRPIEECEKAIECLSYDLNIGKELGAKGVVVHCGKSLKMKKEESIQNMYNNIINMLPHISSSCPLLIETPAGQGTELLTMYNEFSEFYNRFTTEQKHKIKICIDTCHIFAAQKEYKPLEYITKWEQDHPNSIVLIHYNDSKGDHGCCKDRHEWPGQGKIGPEEMNNVKIFCHTNKFPMVIEC